MTYVLIIFLFTTQGAGVTTAEFSSLAACEFAAEAVQPPVSAWGRTAKTVCVPK